MKAHYNPISKKLQKHINARADAEFIKQRDDFMRRFLKLSFVAQNEEFGHGAERFGRYVSRLMELGKHRDDDEVFWAHIDIFCKHHGVHFPDEDYERMNG